MLKRRQWRNIYLVYDSEERNHIIVEEEEPQTGDAEKRKAQRLRCILMMKKRIEKEIRDLCRECYIETKYFLTTALSTEARVFYLKIIADTFRYLAQIEQGHTLMRLIEETDRRYEQAKIEAQSLDAANPLRLALGLNYSSFKYEIEQNFE